MYEAVDDYFRLAEAHDFKGLRVAHHDSVDAGHGRVEARHYTLSRDGQSLPDINAWSGLKAIGMVKRERINKRTGDVSEERHYYLTTATDVSVFAQAARAHWGVENRLHWVLDVVFKDDASRVRVGNGPRLFNGFRQMANNLLRGMNNKDSLRSRRYRCALEDDYRASALFGE